MSNDTIQALLLILSALAITLALLGNKRLKLAGCLVGLAAQPFWMLSAWHSKAWGIGVLTLWYTGVYLVGALAAWLALCKSPPPKTLQELWERLGS